MSLPPSPTDCLPRLLALLSDDVQITRLTEAATDRYQVVLSPNWAELLMQAEQQSVAFIVFDLYAAGPPCFDIVRSLRTTYPRTSLVAYQKSPSSLGDIFDLGRLQVNGLIVFDHSDSVSSISSLLDHAEARTVSFQVRQRLHNASSAARDAVLLAITRAYENLSPTELAERLKLSRRVLVCHLAEANLPHPAALLTWGRLIIASTLLEGGLRSADSVALSLGFSSPSSFRNTCQRYLHTTPHGIKALGGSAWVINAMFTTLYAPEPQASQDPNCVPLLDSQVDSLAASKKEGQGGSEKDSQEESQEDSQETNQAPAPSAA